VSGFELKDLAKKNDTVASEKMTPLKKIMHNKAIERE